MTEQISNNKKIIIVKVTKPDYLSGLTGAIYILKCLSDGLSKDQIISDIFEGDRQLVFIWIEFLQNHHWLEENENSNPGDHGRVKITYEGSKLISEYSFEFENDLGDRRTCIHLSRY
jgi:hypothetical protein